VIGGAVATFSGGIGVSRRLKPFEREPLEILPIDFLYLAAVAENAGASVTFVDARVSASPIQGMSHSAASAAAFSMLNDEFRMLNSMLNSILNSKF
jgi:hypothetical protein